MISHWIKYSTRTLLISTRKFSFILTPKSNCHTFQGRKQSFMLSLKSKINPMKQFLSLLFISLITFGCGSTQDLNSILEAVTGQSGEPTTAEVGSGLKQALN